VDDDHATDPLGTPGGPPAANVQTDRRKPQQRISDRTTEPFFRMTHIAFRSSLPEPATLRPTRSRAAWVTTLIVLLACASACVVPAAAFAGDSRNVCSAKPFVVKIHADWCATCRKVDAVWTKLGTEMSDQVSIVEFDVSDRVAFEQSREAAEQLGLADFFREYRSRTGTIAVLDCKSREPVAIMNGEVDLSKYLDAISKASRQS
jgi:thiol-disulfide isomerase/thioredoxin